MWVLVLAEIQNVSMQIHYFESKYQIIYGHILGFLKIFSISMSELKMDSTPTIVL